MLSHFDVSLLGLLASYLLQTSAAYFVCLVLCRLILRPAFRFAVWISFLIGIAVYWIVIVFLLEMPAGAAIMQPVSSHSASSALSTWAVWSVPAQWHGAIATVLHVLVWVYSLGVAASLAYMIERRIRLRALISRAMPASAELNRVVEILGRQAGVGECRVLVLPELTSPATAFTRRPTILVPEFLELYLAADELRDVLSHELVHVKRRDFLWQSLVELLNCLIFFHPAAWLATRRYQHERELACDASVVQAQEGRRLQYAECLTSLARLRNFGGSPSVAIDFARSRSLLSLRVRTLLTPRPRRPVWKNVLCFSAGALLLTAFTILSPWLEVGLRFAPEAALRAEAFPVKVPAVQLRTYRARRVSRAAQKKLVLEPAPVDWSGSATPPVISATRVDSFPSSARLLNTAGTVELPTLRQPPESTRVIFHEPRQQGPLPDGSLPKARRPRHRISIPWTKVGVAALTAAIAFAQMEADGDGAK